MVHQWQPPRDFVGYGANPPNPKWPDGARIAVNFVMNYEEGSEASFLDGDEVTDTNMTEAHGVNQPLKGRDPRCREHVRVRQPRRVLAADAFVPRAQTADDYLCMCAGYRAQSGGGESNSQFGI